MNRLTVETALLFDFFGDLLTERQRTYFDLYYNEDLSLSEIAEERGVTRQAVWDIIRRAETTLRELEQKTRVVARFTRMQRDIGRLQDLAEEIRRRTGEPEIRVLADTLQQQLQELKGENDGI